MEVAVTETFLPEPEQQIYEGKAFPKILCLERPVSLEAAVQWVKDNKADIQRTLETHGAVLFRDFPLPTPEDFHSFLMAFEWKHEDYIGN